MLNMSYCRFYNTLQDLKECESVICGNDESYQCISDLSESESESLMDLLDVCKHLINLYDDNDEFFIRGDV